MNFNLLMQWNTEKQQSKWATTTYMNLMKFTSTESNKTGKMLKNTNRMVPFTVQTVQSWTIYCFVMYIFVKGNYKYKIDVVIFGRIIKGIHISIGIGLRWHT